MTIERDLHGVPKALGPHGQPMGAMHGWQLAGRFIIDAESEDEADRALKAIERAAKRAAASVTIHVHASEPSADASREERRDG